MDEAAIRASILAKARIEFARSGGPGGQNVNKVNSKATVRVPLAGIEGLSEAERAQVELRLGGRLTRLGELVVSADEERDQLKNRKAALERLCGLVSAAARIPKKRKPTKPTAAARERRLKAKKIRAARIKARDRQD